MVRFARGGLYFFLGTFLGLTFEILIAGIFGWNLIRLVILIMICIFITTVVVPTRIEDRSSKSLFYEIMVESDEKTKGNNKFIIIENLIKNEKGSLLEKDKLIDRLYILEAEINSDKYLFNILSIIGLLIALLSTKLQDSFEPFQFKIIIYALFIIIMLGGLCLTLIGSREEYILVVMKKIRSDINFKGEGGGQISGI